ncbi:MAG: helix-turn-helix domain-containing protein, partial [Kofleriaceae bacterium]
SLVWGQSVGSVRTVDNFVGQLRKRFEADPEQPRHFITVRGSGYRFDP